MTSEETIRLTEAAQSIGLTKFPDLQMEVCDWETRVSYSERNGVEYDHRGQICVMLFERLDEAKARRLYFSNRYPDWRVYRRGNRVVITLKEKAVA